jgi:hypothetical protein
MLLLLKQLLRIALFMYKTYGKLINARKKAIIDLRRMTWIEEQCKHRGLYQHMPITYNLYKQAKKLYPYPIESSEYNGFVN